jgi:hypothetical protein
MNRIDFDIFTASYDGFYVVAVLNDRNTISGQMTNLGNGSIEVDGVTVTSDDLFTIDLDF